VQQGMLAAGERRRGCRRRCVEQGNPTAAGHGAGASGGAQSTVQRGAEQGPAAARRARASGGAQSTGQRRRAEQGLAAALRVGVGGGGEQGKSPAAGCGAGEVRGGGGHNRGRRRRRVGPAGGDAEQGTAGGDMPDRVFFARFVWRKGEVKKKKDIK
jgi:hypothetical protein